MKKILLITYSMLVSSMLFSQITNDDCSTATDLGFVEYIPDTTSTGIGWNCFDGMADMDTGFYYNSTENALVNYPYPIFDLQCDGYTSYNLGQNNDVWYKVSGVSCDLVIAFICSDTTHMNIWYGNDCSSLCPEKCYTLLPGAYFYDTLYSIGAIPIYFQISGRSVNTYVYNYSLCLEGSVASCLGDSIPCLTDFETNIKSYSQTNSISISPNPSSETITINGSDIQRIEVFDVDGRILINTNDKNIDISNQDKGLYFVKIVTLKGSETKKILIE